jgi:hypothetical protein
MGYLLTVYSVPQEALLKRDGRGKIGRFCFDFGPLCRCEAPQWVVMTGWHSGPVLYNFLSGFRCLTQEKSHD